MLNASQIIVQLDIPTTKLVDLRILAKDIKVNHELAMLLWDSEKIYPRHLAILIIDKNKISQEKINRFVQDISIHDIDIQTQLMDWFMANQFIKNKKLINLMINWQNHSSSLLRRLFWYYQGRLRWMGSLKSTNSDALLKIVEEKLANETPEVQWAMNFTTAQIGIFDEALRERCMAIGEKIGLYKDEIVHKNCTPNYLPNYIKTEVLKKIKY